MRTEVGALMMIALVAAAGPAGAACTLSQSAKCVDLDAVPQISEQIVARERFVAPPKSAPRANPDTPYTGPTIGVNRQLRQAPEVGYRWAIN